MKYLLFAITLFVSVSAIAQKKKAPVKDEPKKSKTLEVPLKDLVPGAGTLEADTIPKYADSSITLLLTQRAAIYIGQSIKRTFEWKNRNAPNQLKNYIGSGNNYDSLLGSITLKASLIKGMIDMLFDLPGAVVEKDKLSIINNSPAIPGYIALQNQINTKANGISSEKNVAIWLRDYFVERTDAYNALRLENINGVVEWANN